ncbi:MAG: hypothetical protein PHU71_03095 [Candidatus Gracilibacteria bacterium]|nr:hypothetical protein [Candidatus Gracilibacteria bacterium]
MISTSKKVSVKIDPTVCMTGFIRIFLGRPEYGAIRNVRTKLDEQTGLLEVSTDQVTREELRAALIAVGHKVVD